MWFIALRWLPSLHVHAHLLFSAGSQQETCLWASAYNLVGYNGHPIALAQQMDGDGIKVVLLPGRGRSLIACRTFRASQLIIKQQAYGWVLQDDQVCPKRCTKLTAQVQWERCKCAHVLPHPRWRFDATIAHKYARGLCGAHAASMPITAVPITSVQPGRPIIESSVQLCAHVHHVCRPQPCACWQGPCGGGKGEAAAVN